MHGPRLEHLQQCPGFRVHASRCGGTVRVGQSHVVHLQVQVRTGTHTGSPGAAGVTQVHNISLIAHWFFLNAENTIDSRILYDLLDNHLIKT